MTRNKSFLIDIRQYLDYGMLHLRHYQSQTNALISRRNYKTRLYDKFSMACRVSYVLLMSLVMSYTNLCHKTNWIVSLPSFMI